MSYLSDASLVMIPSGVEAGTVFTSKPAGGSADLTFTRSNDTATRVGPNGYIEKVRTNAVLHSEDQSNAVYNVINQNITSITSAANPLTGTNNAYKVLCNGSEDPYVGQQVYGLSNGQNTFSCWLWTDSGESTEASLFFYNAATTEVFFEALTITTTPTRYSIIADFTSIGALAVCRIDLRNASGSPTYLYTYGWQAEVGSVATDYIPTTTAAVSVGPLANVPRINFDPVLPRTGSLLLEPQRTNLMLQSENLNASWTPVRAIATSNAATSPDGYANADKLIADTITNTTHLFYQNKTSQAAGTYTYSAFFKKAEYEFGAVRIATDSDAKRFGAVVNLNTGAVTATDSFGSPTGTSSKVENYGNGWYRLIVTCAHTSGDVLVVSTLSPTAVPTFSSSLPAFTGDNTSGIYTWGAQLEEGAYATSYIPTYSAAATRGADACSKTGISSVIGQTEGTLFVEAKVTLDGRLLLIGTTGNFIEILTSSNNKVRAYVYNGAEQADILSTSTYATGDTLKIALAYKQNDFALYVNGTEQGTDTSGNIPTGMAQLIVNDYTVGGYNSANAYSQALLFQTRLTNDQLSQITTL